MVYESRVGDVFTLGTSSWRIEDITHDQVLVTPAPGLPGRLPFWKGDTLGRPVRAGPGGRRSSSARWRRCPRPRRASGWRWPGSTSGPPTTCSPTSTSRSRRPATCRATGPSSSSGSATSWATGGWSCTRRSGRRCTPRGRCASSARMRERYGVDVQAMHADDGIVLPAARPRVRRAGRGPDLEGGPGAGQHRWRRSGGHGRADVAGPARAGRRARPGHRADRRFGAVRLAVPRVRGAGPAAAAATSRPAPGAVAAAAALGPAARGGQPVPLVPDRPRGGPRVRPGRLRRAGPGRPDDPDPVAGGHDGRRRDRAAVAVRPVAHLRLRRAVHLRGRLAAGRAPGRGAVARPDPARRAARPRRRAEPARPARPGGGRPDRGRAAAARRLPALPRRRGRRRPAPRPRPAPPRGGRRALRGGRRPPGRRALARRARGLPAGDPGARRRRGALGRRRGRRRGCATRSASRCRSASPTPSSNRSATRSATSSPGMRAPTARSGPRRSRSGTAWATPWSPTPCAGWSAAGRLVEGELRPDPTGSAAGGLDFCDAGVLRTLRRRSLAALRAEVEPVTATDFARFLPQLAGRRRDPARHRGPGPRGRAAGRCRRPGQRAGDPGPARRGSPPTRRPCSTS